MKKQEIINILNTVQSELQNGEIHLDSHIEAIERALDNDNLEIAVYNVIDKSIASSNSSADSYVIQKIRINDKAKEWEIFSGTAYNYDNWVSKEWEIDFDNNSDYNKFGE